MFVRLCCAVAVVALAVLTGCSVKDDEAAKARWAASYKYSCLKNATAAHLDEYGTTYCRCEAEKYVATFSAVQLALMYIPGTLHEAGRAIDKQCGIIAAAQIRYDRMMTAIGARNGYAAIGYLARNFVSVQLWGRTENANQMVTRMVSLPKDVFEATIIHSAREAGKTITVDRSTFEGWPEIVNGKKERHSIYTTFEDTWIVGAGTMLLQRSATKSVDAYTNGKLVASLKASS
ncbi:MAG TPA: hypothetical protein VGK84_08110 [Candidatus Tumulicola sp.]